MYASDINLSMSLCGCPRLSGAWPSTIIVLTIKLGMFSFLLTDNIIHNGGQFLCKLVELFVLGQRLPCLDLKYLVNFNAEFIPCHRTSQMGTQHWLEVMAWCRKGTSNYLSQSWLRSMPLYRPYHAVPWDIFGNARWQTFTPSLYYSSWPVWSNIYCSWNIK